VSALSHSTAQNGIQEIAEILAAGLLRVRARKSSQVAPLAQENSLDFSLAESGDPAPRKRRTSDE
jgi:hypothetical protein